MDLKGLSTYRDTFGQLYNIFNLEIHPSAYKSTLKLSSFCDVVGEEAMSKLLTSETCYFKSFFYEIVVIALSSSLVKLGILLSATICKQPE